MAFHQRSDICCMYHSVSGHLSRQSWRSRVVLRNLLMENHSPLEFVNSEIGFDEDDFTLACHFLGQC